MNLPLRTFTSLVEQMAASVQGAAAQLIDLSVGSVLRSLLEASAAAALWLQWLILQVLTVTRAATSTGADLDSWMADYGLSRLGGTAATGTVTFGRYTIGISAIVPLGAQVLTSDGSQTFAVVAQPANPAWNGSGYTLPATAAAVDVPVQAAVPGTGGNIQAGTIGILATAIPGVDTVSNGAPFSGGLDAETDIAFRARFQRYINSRSLATPTAVGFATESVQPGLRYAILENQNLSGSSQPGYFCVYADDGTGAPSATLLQSVQSAVDAVRPIGSIYRVSGPVVVPVTVTMSLETSNPLTRATVAAGVEAAVASWVQGLPFAATLALSRIDAVAHSVDASIVSVMNLQINGAASDVTAPANGVLIVQTVSVN